MITTGILKLVYSLLSGIISLFPAGTGFPTEVHSAFQTLGSYIGLIDPFVAVSTLLWCLKLILGVELALFGFKFFRWIISHIPLIGGRGNN